MTIAEKLRALVNLKVDLASNLTKKGITASATETYTTLVPKVLNIKNTVSIVGTEFVKCANLADVYTSAISVGLRSNVVVSYACDFNGTTGVAKIQGYNGSSWVDLIKKTSKTNNGTLKLDTSIYSQVRGYADSNKSGEWAFMAISVIRLQ